MLTRIIVAVVAIPIIVVLILLAPVWTLGIIVGAIAACAAWEFLHCTEGETKPRLCAYAAVVGFCIPFLNSFYEAGRVYELMLLLLMAVLMGELMLSFRRQTLDFNGVAKAMLAGGVFPIMLSAIVRLARLEEGRVYAMLPFIICFSSDSGAYFAGVFLGKHKITPTLSPHKTMEGSIGGFVLAIALSLVYGLILRSADYIVNFPVLGAYGFLGALAAQLGDLSFSAVKRLSRVKDYGDLIPGHGGVLDRFDSMIWCAPLLWQLVCWVPAITK